MQLMADNNYLLYSTKKSSKIIGTKAGMLMFVYYISLLSLLVDLVILHNGPLAMRHPKIKKNDSLKK